jgi:formylglycine-generating enzyme required for sulfatase activity
MWWAGFLLALWAGSLGLCWGESKGTRVTNSLGMEFVLIQAGSFEMGSPPDEIFRDPDEIRHRVTLSKPYFLQVTEVTQGQWKALMGSNPSYSKRCGDRCPVERVSWADSQRFIEKLNRKGEGTYRLPTEAEWEYASRAGTSSAFHWGNEVDCTKAMFDNNTRRGTNRCGPHVEARKLRPDSPAPVKSYDPNPWGLFDMHGNVWEWCQDWFGPYPNETVTDPKGPDSGSAKVRRGGSWFRFGTFCRSANRNRAHPESRYSTTGFRLVREVEPERESRNP